MCVLAGWGLLRRFSPIDHVPSVEHSFTQTIRGKGTFGRVYRSSGRGMEGRPLINTGAESDSLASL